MHRYEVMFIIRPDTPEDEMAKLVAQMEGYVTGTGGKLEKSEKMGRRKLAYRIERYREGFYVLFVLEGEPAVVTELERRMKVTDSVIKFLTVRVDEQLKRGAKMRAIRKRKESRRRKPAQAQHPAPQAAGPSQT
ncbi:MAG: 30S ribosomal protein S6 [Terriglobia bacterium]